MKKDKEKTIKMVFGCVALLIAASAQAEMGSGAFGFLGGDGETLSLFGVRLGQKMNAVEVCQPPHNNIKAKSEQYEYCKFTPSGEAYDSRFKNYTVCIDRTNRQVVAVFASTGLKCGTMDVAERRLMDFFEYVFGKLGNCETRMAEEMWQSGLMTWAFFFPSADTGFVATSHTQFGETVCLYDRNDMVFDRTGFAFFVPDKPYSAKPWWGRHSPTVELYRKYLCVNNSTASLFARHFAVSEKLLKSNRIATTTNDFATVESVGCFDSCHVSSHSTYGNGVYDLDGYKNGKFSIDGRLYLFRSKEDSFNFGIAQLIGEPLPAAVLAGKVKRLDEISDICFIRSDGFPRARGDRHTGAVLIRANAVLVCEIQGETVDIGAGLSTLFDFYEEFANSGYRKVLKQSGTDPAEPL